MTIFHDDKSKTSIHLTLYVLEGNFFLITLFFLLFGRSLGSVDSIDSR